MAMIISFVWTVPALLAGEKTRTRRQWDDRYAARFRAGMTVDAYDRSPRYRGKKVTEIVLTADPVLQPISEMPDEDYEREGFAFFERHPDLIPKKGLLGYGIQGPWRVFRIWRRAGGMYWVIDFKANWLGISSTQTDANSPLKGGRNG